MSDATHSPSQSGEADAGADHQMLKPQRLLTVSAIFILSLVALAAVLGAFFRAPLQRVSRAFVDVLGGPGIAAGYFIPDAFTVPIPNDAFGWFGLEGGMPFGEVVLWGTLGSILGGCLGYLIGRRLRATRIVERYMRKRGRALERLIRRYGVLVVAIAAVSPLPYSLSAWAAGAVHMPFPTFFAVSLCRVVRVAGALYLIQLGLLTAGG